MLESVENEVLNDDGVLLSGRDEADGSESISQVEGKEIGRWSLVVALGNGLSQRNANLEAKSDAGKDLSLDIAELLLNVAWNVGTLDVLEPVGTGGRVLAHKLVGLVVEVLELALA
jgi:hypothetical protein